MPARHLAVWTLSEPVARRPQLTSGEGHLWLLSLDAPGFDPHSIAQWLSPDELERASRFHFDIHRTRYVAGRAQMRYLLSSYIGCAPHEVRFNYGPQGKPILADVGAPYFNLSHSEGLALLGLSLDAEIGVDIEAVREMSDASDVARDNFSPSEFAEWEGLPSDRRTDGFFACWTRKEAIVKALGGGLSIPLDSFKVTLEPSTPARLISMDGQADASSQWSLWGEEIMLRYWAAVAVHAPNQRIRLFAPDFA